ncbi:MAG: HEAT repeat domain-containing protein [Acidobacteriota bacterium]|nr:HEAT repeat domain-containing protein [Acidobacteriota bacterium]
MKGPIEMTQNTISRYALACLLPACAFLNAQDAPLPPVPPAPFLPSMAPVVPLPPLPPSGDFPLFAMQAPAPRAAREAERAIERQARYRDNGDRYYSSGKSYLDRREYDRAVEAFNHVVEEKGPRADGALYWRAYADNKLGKRADALASLAELQKNYASSRWLEDAKALQVEMEQAAGRPISPESATDEELKLLALNSLTNSDPERSVPMLEKLLKSGNSARLKERALFVLAQSRSQKARDVVSQVARGNYNPDLQLKAVEYLGVFGGKENQQALSDIYKSTSDVAIKRRILNSFMACGCRESLLAVAKGESNPELRIYAIRQLGAMGASADLMQLYSPDASYDVKRAVLQGYFVSGNTDKILEIARTDKDPKLRLEAIRQLGPMGRSKSGEALAALYAKESDAQIRREVLNGLFVQGNAAAIVDVARKETDPSLKREAVQRLSHMRSKEATDYLVEILSK